MGGALVLAAALTQLIENGSSALLRKSRIAIALFMVGLVMSGATAIPVEWELRLLLRLCHAVAGPDAGQSSELVAWIERVYNALHITNAQYPFIGYGFDWLAFGHFCIALVFVGPLRDPVKNIWVLKFGMICCALVVPYAFLFGTLRGIPLYWRLIDCGFGVIGFPIIWYAHRCAAWLETPSLPANP